jgi:hypothetical protein
MRVLIAIVLFGIIAFALASRYCRQSERARKEVAVEENENELGL